MEDIRIPQYLHRPYQVLFFEVDELFALIIMLFLAISFGTIFWVLLVPYMYMLSYFKKKYPRGYLKHLFYVLGLINFKNAPSYYETKFYE